MEKNQKENWIIAIAVAIIYLTVSILFDLWAFSWIIWVAYAIYIIDQSPTGLIERKSLNLLDL